MKPKRLIGGKGQDAGEGDPRPRRDLQVGRPVKFPLVEREGVTEIQNDPKGAIGVDPARGQYVRAGQGLAVAANSPYALDVQLGAGFEFDKRGRVAPRKSRTIRTNARGQLEAAVTTADVADPDDGTAYAALARKANTADRRFPVARGRVALIAGSATVAVASITASDSVVLLSHGTLSGTQGMLSSTISDGVGFGITSSSGTDAGTVHYAVWNAS